MNPIHNAACIEAAFSRAQRDTSQGQKFNEVTGEEMRAVIDIAKRDDGVVSKDEAKFIGHLALTRFANHTLESNAEIMKMLAAHQLSVEDLWK